MKKLRDKDLIELKRHLTNLESIRVQVGRIIESSVDGQPSLQDQIDDLVINRMEALIANAGLIKTMQENGRPQAVKEDLDLLRGILNLFELEFDALVAADTGC